MTTTVALLQRTVNKKTSCSGFVAGFALGGTVGFFKWMFNSFENDDITNTAPKNVRPPLEPERDTTVHRHYIDMGG